jgi:hypothetical protein
MFNKAPLKMSPANPKPTANSSKRKAPDALPNHTPSKTAKVSKYSEPGLGRLTAKFKQLSPDRRAKLLQTIDAELADQNHEDDAKARQEARARAKAAYMNKMHDLWASIAHVKGDLCSAQKRLDKHCAAHNTAARALERLYKDLRERRAREASVKRTVGVLRAQLRAWWADGTLHGMVRDGLADFMNAFPGTEE